MNNKEVFISFSSTENDEAMRIVDMLEGEGISCFISSRDLTPGIEYAGQLVDYIDNASVVVLLLSKASNASPHVLREIEYAVSHRVPIVVYKMEEVELSRSLEYFLMTHQWLHGEKNLDKQLINSIRLLKEGHSNERLENTPVKTKKADSSKMPVMIAILAAAVLVLIVCMVITIMALSGKIARPDKDSQSSSKELTEAVDYELGDTVTFGSYLGEPIEWRVLKLNDDGTMMLVSKYILTLKSFDAAEGGKYGEYNDINSFEYSFREVTDEDIIVKVLGNNDWTCSNLRTWLNSEKEVVKYPDQEPSRSAVFDGVNSYSTEPGFLHNFTIEEREALIPTRIRVKANSFSQNEDGGYAESMDLVYLLSEKQLKFFEEADMSIYAEPTETAKDEDQSGYIEDMHNYFDTKYYYWWLLDGADDYIGKVKMVNTDYEVDAGTITSVNSAASTYVGVRPAITLSQDYNN